MIKEDVPIDEVNCGEGYWHFSRRKKTEWSKASFTCLRILMINLIEISLNFD